MSTVLDELRRKAEMEVERLSNMTPEQATEVLRRKAEVEARTSVPLEDAVKALLNQARSNLQTLWDQIETEQAGLSELQKQEAFHQKVLDRLQEALGLNGPGEPDDDYPAPLPVNVGGQKRHAPVPKGRKVAKGEQLDTEIIDRIKSTLIRGGNRELTVGQIAELVHTDWYARQGLAFHQVRGKVDYQLNRGPSRKDFERIPPNRAKGSKIPYTYRVKA